MYVNIQYPEFKTFKTNVMRKNKYILKYFWCPPDLHWLKSKGRKIYDKWQTNSSKQLETNFVGVLLLSVQKPPPSPHNTTPDVIIIKAVQCNQGGWFFICNLISTQLHELWKMTYIFFQMEDDLHCFWMEDNLQK